MNASVTQTKTSVCGEWSHSRDWKLALVSNVAIDCYETSRVNIGFCQYGMSTPWQDYTIQNFTNNKIFPHVPSFVALVRKNENL